MNGLILTLIITNNNISSNSAEMSENQKFHLDKDQLNITSYNFGQVVRQGTGNKSTKPEVTQTILCSIETNPETPRRNFYDRSKCYN